MLNITLILHNIRSSHNVGSIFRTAECAGVKKIFLTGYTPAPRDNFERENKEIAKTALGAEKIVKWQTRLAKGGEVESLSEIINRLKREKFKIIALEQDKNSVDYKQFARENKDENLALILGNEVEGITPEILQICDKIIEIPMRGEKESLNVSVAAGIAIFRLLDL